MELYIENFLNAGFWLQVRIGIFLCGVIYFTVNHIVPKSKGGPDTDENLQLLCGNCNSVKGDRTQEYLILKVRSMAG